MIMPKSQCRFRRSKLLPSSVLILFTIIGQIFAQNTFKSIQLRLQICSGQDIGDDEQKDIILKSFLGNIPILGENSSLEIVPSIHQSQNCEAGVNLRKNYRSQITELNEIDAKTAGFSKGSITAYISYENDELIFQSENSTYTLKQFCVSPKVSIDADNNKPSKKVDESQRANFAIFECRHARSRLHGCSQHVPCIRKCCPIDEAWDVKNSSCQKVDIAETASRAWDPNFYEVTDDGDCVIKLKDLHGPNTPPPQFHYDIGPPRKCGQSEEWNVIPSRNIPGELGLGRFRMLLNGSVLMNYDNGSWVSLSRGTYCVDEIMTTMHHNKNGTLRRCRRSTKVLLVCKDEYQLRGPKKPIPSEYATMLFSAATILLLIVIVYLLLWDRHSIYEWTVFFEVLSMIMMIIMVGVSHSVARDATEGYYGSKRCIGLGMASHYFFLATFFWLGIINFEIWWNFRTLTIRNRKSKKWLRLMIYHVFGCGGPAIIVLIGWLLDVKYGLQNDNIDCTSLILPNYGQLNCYISKRAQGPYLYFPIGVLLGFNLLFYSLTVFKMCQYQKNSQQISRNKTNGQFQPVAVFARLFIVMGVSWVFEIVAWAVKPNVRGSVPLYWVIFDIVTLVQAIAIFVIFVCRRDVVESLIIKYPPFQRVLGPLLRLSCCTTKQSKSASPTSGPVRNGLAPSPQQHPTLALNGDNKVSNISSPSSISEQIDLNLTISLKDIVAGQISPSMNHKTFDTMTTHVTQELRP